MSAEPGSPWRLHLNRLLRIGRRDKNMAGCATCRIRKKVPITVIESPFSVNSNITMFSRAQFQAREVIVQRVLPRK